MKQCAICGHAAERRSICHDCRAALKRARDQTVSQFQSLPSFAIAGAPAMPDLRPSRSAPDRRGGRPHPPRAKPAAPSMRKTRVPMAPVQGSVLLEVPPATRSAPFVWVIVTLMVFVVTYVAYRVIVAASETSAVTQDVPAATAQAEAASAAPARDTPLATPSAVPPNPTAEAPPVAAVSPSVAAAPTPAPHVHEAVTKAAPIAKSTERRAPVAVPPAAEMPKDAAPARTENASAVRNAASTGNAVRNDGDAIPEIRPARNANGTGAPGRGRDNVRSEHWQRMATAIKACAGQDFLGGVLCEQKVRIEYCEGYWGQAAECPNGVANDHGQ